MKKKLKLLLKIALTLIALWYVLRKIDVEELRTLLERADALFLLLAIALFNLSKIVSALRLNLFFEAIGLKIAQRYNLILYYVGMFYNLFLPGGIGGDGYKIFILNRHFKKGLKPLFQAILFDRLSGLAALVFLAALLFCFSHYAKILPGGMVLSIGVMILVYPMAYLMTKWFFPSFLPLFSKTLTLGVIVQILQLLSAWAIMASLGISTEILAYLTLFLVSSVMAVLPLTIGGVGIRELTFLYGLDLIHQPPAAGVGFSFLFFIITALSSLMGLFLVNRVIPEGKKE